MYAQVHLLQQPFFLKIFWSDNPPSTRPQMSYTAQSQLSMTLPYYLEMWKIEVVLRGSFHYAILEVSKMYVSQNCAEVVPKSDPICASRKITH